MNKSMGFFIPHHPMQSSHNLHKTFLKLCYSGDMENAAHTIDATEKPLPLKAEEHSAASTAAPEDQKKDSYLNRVLKIATFPVAGISALFVGGNELHQEAYKNLKQIDGNIHFKAIQEKYNLEFNKTAKQFEVGEINKEVRLQKDAITKKNYSDTIGHKMDELGYSPKWGRLKDLPNKWNRVNRTTKLRAFGSGAAVAGIAIGALLTIANSKTLTELFADKENKDQGKLL